MHSATVIQAGLDTHPESGKRLLKITVDASYEVAGVSYSATDIWAEAQAPVPAFGDVVSWDHRHVMLSGRTWRKVENDSNPAERLH